MLKIQNWSWAKGLNSLATLLMFFPLLPLRIGVLLAIVFGTAVFLAQFFVKEKNSSRPGTGPILIALGLFLGLYFKDCLFATELERTWKITEKKLGLLLLPLSYLFAARIPGFSPGQRPMWLFGTGLLILCLYTWIGLGLYGLDSELYSSGGLAYALRTQMEAISGLHPTYFGLFNVFALLYWLDWKFLRKNKTKLDPLIALCAGMLFLTTLCLATKGPLLLLFLGCLFCVYRSGLPRKWKNLSTLGLLAISLLLIYSIPSLRERSLDLLSKLGTQSSERLIIWKSAWQVAVDDLPWGTGIERLQEKLNGQYLQYGEIGQLMAQRRMNTHNEFLQALAAHGLLGLFLLVGLFLLFWRHSAPIPGYWGSLILIIGLCFTENILDRQMGVFFVGIMVGYYVMWGGVHRTSEEL